MVPLLELFSLSSGAACFSWLVACWVHPGLFHCQSTDKAVHLYVKAKEIDQALDLCFNHNILITEDMAEAMNSKHQEMALRMLRIALQQRETRHNYIHSVNCILDWSEQCFEDQ